MIVDRSPAARDARRVGGWLFVLALSVYLFTAGGSMTITDAVVMFDVTQNLVEHQTVAMSSSLLGMEAHRGCGRQVLFAVWRGPIALQRSVLPGGQTVRG